MPQRQYGLWLAMVGAAKGYRVTILMSESASLERRQIVRHLGAELVLFQAGRGYQTGIDLAREMAARDDRYFLTCQCEGYLEATGYNGSSQPSHAHVTISDAVNPPPNIWPGRGLPETDPPRARYIRPELSWSQLR